MCTDGETTRDTIWWYNAPMSQFQTTLASLPGVAKTILEHITPSPRSASTLTLTGDLGAGKTTFMQALAKELGVQDVVTSPTFVVLRVYDTKHPHFTRLVHMDAYRFESPDEVLPLGLSTYFSDSQTLVCIEWPERLGKHLPSSCHTLSFRVVDEVTRDITYGKN